MEYIDCFYSKFSIYIYKYNLLAVCMRDIIQTI